MVFKSKIINFKMESTINTVYNETEELTPGTIINIIDKRCKEPLSLICLLLKKIEFEKNSWFYIPQILSKKSFELTKNIWKDIDQFYPNIDELLTYDPSFDLSKLEWINNPYNKAWETIGDIDIAAEYYSNFKIICHKKI